MTVRSPAVKNVYRCFSVEPEGSGLKRTLKGKTLLYVGGRTNQVPKLRAMAEEYGAALLHHDGGLHENSRSLSALTARADAVLFPVDCISHGGMATVKRICKQLGKNYFPLRRSGVSSFACLIRDLSLQLA
jgi:hypothetical protein